VSSTPSTTQTLSEPARREQRPLRVVVAPDSFKGSLGAAQVAHAVAAGVRAVVPDAQVVELPMADGGEGTLDALLAVWGDPAREVATVDAIGRPRTARYGVSRDGRLGVVELAEASGLPQVSDVALQPLHAHTLGTGAAAAAVLDAGVDEVIVCLGGSASTDGGAGVLTGLGARLLDDRGEQVPDGGEGLAQVARLDLSGLHPRALEVRWRLAVDVTNPLHGERGAAHVFGPQKGARAADVAFLDAALRRWAGVLEQEAGFDVSGLAGAGAAGGVPAAAVGILGAELEPGARLVAEAIGLPAEIYRADLVLTGEGSFDSQSVNGKVADAMGALAAEALHRPPVVVLAGRVLLPAAQARDAGIAAAFSIAPGPIELEELLDRTASRLTDLAATVTSLFVAARR